MRTIKKGRFTSYKGRKYLWSIGAKSNFSVIWRKMGTRRAKGERQDFQGTQRTLNVEREIGVEIWGVRCEEAWADDPWFQFFRRLRVGFTKISHLSVQKRHEIIFIFLNRCRFGRKLILLSWLIFIVRRLNILVFFGINGYGGEWISIGFYCEIFSL